MNDTSMLDKHFVAFVNGVKSYPFSIEAGQRAARIWLTGKPKTTLVAFRENCWEALTESTTLTHQEHQAFNEGFASALAAHISGGNHE